MSKVLEFEARASVESQARVWLVRLDADEPLSNEERAALRAWMTSHPSHRAELIRLSKFWRQANVLTELAVPIEHASRARRMWRELKMPALAIAATAALALVAVLVWRPDQNVGKHNGIYGTAIGQQHRIDLPDGSSIALNTDSQVQVSYGDRIRKIHLLRGEALFTVAHDSSRPFEVRAAEGVVRAVGTAFSVRVEDMRVSVTVTTGVVDVARTDKDAPTQGDSIVEEVHTLGRLKAGQMTTFGNEGSIAVRQLDQPELRRQVSWQEGYLEFSGEPLSEVVAQMNRYSPVTLRIADPQLADLAIGGRFRVGDLQAVLEVLSSNFGVESRRVDDRTIRLEAARSDR